MKTFKEKYGPWALITGASQGIGAETAYQCAALGLNCVMVALPGDQLERHKETIEKKYNVKVKTVSMDLSHHNFLEKLIPHIKNLDIGLLVNNAGISNISEFIKHTPEDLLKQFDLNARASLILARYFAEKMAAKQKGGIICLSSGSALFGTAYVANYAGTKAYNLILAESLWYEMKKYNVDVLGFMPGSTDTPGYNQHNPEKNFFIRVRPADKTVASMLKVLGKKPSHIDGLSNRISFWFLKKFLSRKQAINIISPSMEKVFKSQLEE